MKSQSSYVAVLALAATAAFFTCTEAVPVVPRDKPLTFEPDFSKGKL